MKQKATIDSPHMVDGDILRFHDHECEPAERDSIARHLRECSECAESARFFQAASKQLLASLDEIDVQPVPNAKERFLAARAGAARSSSRQRNNRRVHLLRAAAVVFALLGAGMWAPPVRAWFVELFTPSRPNAAQAVATADENDATLRSASTVSFVPSGPAFAIDIASHQAGGTLTIRMGDGDAAAARVTGRAPSDSMLVTGNGIRITNSAASSAEYTVTVPRTVRRIIVRLGGSASGNYPTTTIEEQDSLVIALTR